MAQNLVIVLVPGGMGSKLSLSGSLVWNYKFSLLPPAFETEGIRMIIDPGLVLPWLPLEAVGLLSVYDDLIAFLGSNGYHTVQAGAQPQNLFLFPYDWRQGMEANAILLAKFVNTQIVPTLGANKILFIAHSSGCMVVRWALLFGSVAGGPPRINPALVKRVVAAGPPMLGMASPFKDIVWMPRLDDTFDTLYGVLKVTYPSLADQVSEPLKKCLMTVTAQLEGLPPDSIEILEGGMNPPSPTYCALDWSGWPPALGALIGSIRNTRVQLDAVKWAGTDCTVVASNSTPTDTGYKLKPNNEYQSSWATDWGDGSVLLHSALAYCPDGDSLIVNQIHRKLLDDAATRAYLQSVIV